MLQAVLFTLRVALAVILGFFAPGYCLARCLGAPARLLWAFPLSLVVLFLAIFSAGCLGLPVTATVVAAILVVVTLILAAIGTTQHGLVAAPISNPAVADRQKGVSKWISVCILGSIGVILAAVIWRTTLWPLVGSDVPFRWGFLAQRMLQQHSFRFYPPMTAADYRLYFYTDGIPPLVSFSYWWLYAVAGSYHPGLTSILLAAQLVCTAGFVYRIGVAVESRLAGLFSIAVLGGANLFIDAVAIGQETGLTALAVAAMVCAVVEAAPDKLAGFGWRAMVMAGLAAALGALAREYGCSFAILGAVVVVWRGGRAKNVAILCGIAALLAGPWYLRNLLRCGNPFFSNRFAGLYVNPVHIAMLDYYRTRLGISTWGAATWGNVGRVVLMEAPLQVTLGVVGAAIFFRKLGFFAVIAAAITALWVYSIGVTSGGWLYALRFLPPLLVALSVPAGILVARWSGRRLARAGSMALLEAALLVSIVVAAVHPFVPTLTPSENWTHLFSVPPPPRLAWWDELPKKLPTRARILCDNCYIYSDMQKRGLALPGLIEMDQSVSAKSASATSAPIATANQLDLVPIWSPEVAFIADDKLTPATIRSMLLEHGIGFIIAENGYNGGFVSHRMRFYQDGMKSWTLLYTGENYYYLFGLASNSDH